MGILRSPLGKITQSIGDMTLSNWKGRNVIKQKVPDTNTSSSPAQVEQRSKFAAMGRAAKLLAPLFRVGYRNAATTTTEYNVFVKTNFPEVKYTGGNASISWNLLQVSTGSVAAPEGVVATYDSATKTIAVTWANNSNGADAMATDLAYIGIVDYATSNLYSSMGTAERAEGAAGITVNVKDNFTVGDAMILMFFRRASSTATSPSVNDNIS